jgi:hypothetical protein
MNNKLLLRENLRPGDLRDTIDPLIEIDRHKPKVDDNSETVVICFKAINSGAAEDLGAFIEWGTKSVNDVEVSDSSDKNGKFHVYIEMRRIPGLSQKIIDLVRDIEMITEKQEWKFTAMDGLRRDFTLPNLNYAIIQDPKIYSLPPESRAYYQRMKNLTKY